MSEQAKRQPELNLLRACVMVAIVPLVFRGTSCGQDFDFHLDSWMNAAHSWFHGVIYPHWLASANYGAGEPRFIFYPPLSWSLGAILGTFLPWTWTPVSFDVLCLLAMGISFYKMACEWMPGHNAEIAACLYVISPYIFFVVYERSALGELLAAVWLPALVLFALRKKPSTLQLALVVAALWFTNAPAAVMGSYALAVIALVAAVSEHRWTLLLRAASAMALGLGLASIYILPAIYEQRWVEIARAIMPGMRIQDSFLFEHTGLAYHDQVLRTASWIAVLLVVATSVAAVLMWRKRKLHPLGNPLIVLAALIAFSLFPISKFLWNSAPELRFLQFPWRWLLLLGLILAVFAGLSLSDSPPTRRNSVLRAGIVLLVAAVFCAHAWRHFWLLCDDEDNVRAQVATLQNQGFEGTDEYTPKGADNGDIQQFLPPVRVLTAPDADEADSSIEQNPEWNPNETDLVPAIIQMKQARAQHLTAEIQSPEPGYAVLRLMDYPAWRISLNGKPAPQVTRGLDIPGATGANGFGRPFRDDGLIVVPVPAGTSTIDARYVTTPDIWAGRAVSLASVFVWLGFWFVPRLRKPASTRYDEANASRNSA